MTTQASIFAEEIFLFQHNLVYPVEKGYWMLTFAPYDPTDQLDFRWIYGHTPASHIQALLPMLRRWRFATSIWRTHRPLFRHSPGGRPADDGAGDASPQDQTALGKWAGIGRLKSEEK